MKKKILSIVAITMMILINTSISHAEGTGYYKDITVVKRDYKTVNKGRPILVDDTSGSPEKHDTVYTYGKTFSREHAASVSISGDIKKFITLNLGFTVGDSEGYYVCESLNVKKGQHVKVYIQDKYSLSELKVKEYEIDDFGDKTLISTKYVTVKRALPPDIDIVPQP